jgi:hypothetical protein
VVVDATASVVVGTPCAAPVVDDGDADAASIVVTMSGRAAGRSVT